MRICCAGATMPAVAMAAGPATTQGGFEGPGRYQITNVNSGKVLALDRNDKATVMQFQPLNRDSEQWDAHPAEEGFWVLRNVMTGAALECTGPQNGAPVRGMPFTQSPAQQWRIEPGPRGNAMITSRVGKTLGVGGGGSADGDRMQSFERNMGPRQEFVFRRIVVAANVRPQSERDQSREREISETHGGYYDDRDGMWKLQGDGACFYRGANFQGKALCVRSGEEMPKVPDDWGVVNHATTSTGLSASSDPRVHFGLGAAERVEKLDIWWPSGTHQTLADVKADQILVVREPGPGSEMAIQRWQQRWTSGGTARN